MGDFLKYIIIFIIAHPSVCLSKNDNNVLKITFLTTVNLLLYQGIFVGLSIHNLSVHVLFIHFVLCTLITANNWCVMADWKASSFQQIHV